MPRGRHTGKTYGGRLLVGDLLEQGPCWLTHAARGQDGSRASATILTGPVAQDEAAQKRMADLLEQGSSVRHPNLESLLWHTMLPGRRRRGEPPMVVSAATRGVSLAHHVREQGPLPPDEACSLVAQVLSGLAALHGEGVAHGGVDPLRIMLRPDHEDHYDHVRLRVPALAGAMLEALVSEAQLSKEIPAGLAGALAFCAPEVLQEEAPGTLTDLNSVGAVLYFTLTGCMPLSPDEQSDTAAELVDSLIYQSPRPLVELRPELPDELVEAVNALLAKDPDERPADADALEALLEHWITPPMVSFPACEEQEPILAPPLPSTPPSQQAPSLGEMKGKAALQRATRRQQRVELQRQAEDAAPVAPSLPVPEPVESAPPELAPAPAPAAPPTSPGPFNLPPPISVDSLPREEDTPTEPPPEFESPGLDADATIMEDMSEVVAQHLNQVTRAEPESEPEPEPEPELEPADDDEEEHFTLIGNLEDLVGPASPPPLPVEAAPPPPPPQETESQPGLDQMTLVGDLEDLVERPPTAPPEEPPPAPEEDDEDEDEVDDEDDKEEGHSLIIGSLAELLAAEGLKLPGDDKPEGEE